MSIAHTLAEFQTQLKRLQYPMWNIMYADRDGHIEYLFNAPVPRRSQGDYAFWSRPVPGDTSSLLPTGSLSYDELPKVIDPLSGYVQSKTRGWLAFSIIVNSFSAPPSEIRKWIDKIALELTE